MERLSRRKILGAAGAFAGGSALAGAAAASGAIAPVPAAGADGDAMALSLFRQWIAAGQDYERQAAADPDRDEYPASAVMWDLEDRIFEIQGTAAALAIKTHFVIRQAHASWGPEPFLRIREAFNDDRDWEIEVAVGMLREAARFVPEIGELAAPVLHPDAALIDAEIEVQWCREQLAKPFRVALDRDDEFARWLRDNDTRHHDETRALLAKMLDRIAGTEAKTARGAAIKAKHAIGAEGLA